jgi:hypothetical protein
LTTELPWILRTSKTLWLLEDSRMRFSKSRRADSVGPQS